MAKKKKGTEKWSSSTRNDTIRKAMKKEKGRSAMANSKMAKEKERGRGSDKSAKKFKEKGGEASPDPWSLHERRAELEEACRELVNKNGGTIKNVTEGKIMMLHNNSNSRCMHLT